MYFEMIAITTTLVDDYPNLGTDSTAKENSATIVRGAMAILGLKARSNMSDCMITIHRNPTIPLGPAVNVTLLMDGTYKGTSYANKTLVIQPFSFAAVSIKKLGRMVDV